MDPQLAQIMTTLSVPEDFKQFIIAQGIKTAEDFGKLCSSEDGVKTEIIEPAKTANVKFDTLLTKSVIVQLWGVCRETIKTQAATKDDGNAASDAPIPKPSADDIAKVWKNLHAFVLPEDWLLIAGLQGKVWRAITADPPTVPVLLVEHLRTLANKDKPVGAQLCLVPGRPLETIGVVSDLCTKPIELYMRIRSFFYTMAYVSVRDTSFFDIQTALFMSEKVLNFVSQTFKNQVPPTAFYVQAWASTAHHLSEQVRISGSTLRDACLQTAGWEHRWTSWSPVAGVGDNNQKEKQNHGGGSHADIPKQILDDIQKAKANAQRWQSEAMKIQNEFNTYKNSNGNGGNRGNGNGGGKDKSTKGQGKQTGNKRNFTEVVDIRDDRRGDRGGDRRGDRR